MIPLLLTAAACLAPWPQQPAGDERTVSCELEQTRIYLGQTVRYGVRLENFEHPERPRLEGMEDFQVSFEGERSESFLQTAFVNGRMVRKEQRSHLYNFTLRPRVEGRLMIPAPVVEADGGTYAGQRLVLTVRRPEEQSLARLAAAVQPAKVWPMQPFTVTLEVLVRELPAASSQPDLDPLAPVRRDPPVLRIPWTELPEGLEADDLESWLGPLAGENYGFAINGLSFRRGFLGERLTTHFLPPSDWVRQAGPDGVEHRYRRYRLTRRISARHAGEYSFGPATLEGMLVSGVERGRLVGDRVFAVSPEVRVEVAPPPAEGRPATYTGAVGAFSVAAELAPLEVSTGDPMTLNLVVSGQGNLEDIQPPDLAALPAVADHFRVYEATAETVADRQQRRFTYSLRPSEAGLKEFPAIPFSFFSVKAGAYRTVETRPIPIKVRPAERLDSGSIVGGEAAARRLEASGAGYFANDENVERMVDRALPGRTLAAWLGGLALSWMVLAGFTARARRLSADPALRRRREAAARARQRLEGALKKQPRDTAGIAEAFRGLFADAAARSASGLTPGEVRRLGTGLGLSPELTEAVGGLLDACDASRFGAAAPGGQDLAARARDLLGRCLEEMKREGCLR